MPASGFPSGFDVDVDADAAAAAVSGCGAATPAAAAEAGASADDEGVASEAVSSFELLGAADVTADGCDGTSLGGVAVVVEAVGFPLDDEAVGAAAAGGGGGAVG